jgi:hypothetical protein
MNENVKQVHRLHKVLEEGGKVIALKLNIYEKSLWTFMQEKLPG